MKSQSSFVSRATVGRLLRTGVFGDGLGAFGHSMLRKLAGQQETNGGLNFPAADGRALVVVGKSGRLRSNAL